MIVALAGFYSRAQRPVRPAWGRPVGPPERRPLVHVDALVLRLAGGWILVGGDGTWVDGRGWPALLRPLGVPLHVPMLPPFPFASPLIKVATPCWFLTETKEVGPASLGVAGRPRARPKNFEIFL